MIMLTNYQNYIHKQNNSYSLSSKLCNKMGYVINPSKYYYREFCFSN